MKKGFTLISGILGCLIMLFVVSCGASTHSHDYVEHAKVDATCLTDGNELYYSCECGQLFDADKNNITAIPVIKAPGHDLEYTVSEDGSKHYSSCKKCDYTTTAVDHTYTAFDGENNTKILKCVCGHEGLTVNTEMAEDNRILVDAWSNEFEIDLTQFASGVSAKTISFDGKTANVTVENNIAKVNVADVVSENTTLYGDQTMSLVVTANDVDLTVNVLVKVACVVDSLEKLAKMAYKGNDVTVGAIKELEHNNVTSQTLFLLTSDLDGLNKRTEEYEVYEEATVEAGIAKAGFRGIFDGQGYTIKNIILKNSIFGQIGKSGLIKNVNFTNITLEGGNTALFGKLMDGTLENVNISNLTIDATRNNQNAGILFGNQVFSAQFKNVYFDASNINQAANLFAVNFDGGVDNEEWNNTTIENLKVKANYGVDLLQLFSGITLLNPIEGLTVEFTPFTVNMPTADTNEYYYSGNEITYVLKSNVMYTITNNKQTEVGVYTVTVSLNNAAASWAGAEEGQEKADLTFTFEIKAFTEEIAQTLADAFNEKVTALGTIVFPKHYVAYTNLMAEYDALRSEVKALLTETKATLDSYQTEYTYWHPLCANENDLVQFIGSSSVTDEGALGMNVKVSPDGTMFLMRNLLINNDSYKFEKVVFYVYNPTENDISGYINDWADGSYNVNVTLAKNAWTEITLKDHYIRQGMVNNYFYVTGQDLLVSNVYAYLNTAAVTETVNAFNAALALLPEQLALTDEDALVALEEEYAGFPTYVKCLLAENITEVFNTYNNQIETLKVQAEIAAVEAKITALDLDNLDTDAVVEAYSAYLSLTDDKKALVNAELVTKLNNCKSAAEEVIRQATIDNFKAKVVDFVLPRDIKRINQLLAEYETLDADVKAALTTEKATLDNYALEIGVWTPLFEDAASLSAYFHVTTDAGETEVGLAVKGNSTSEFSMIAAELKKANYQNYDKLVFYVYNPTDAPISAYYNDWAAGSYNVNYSLAPKAWTEVTLTGFYLRDNLTNNYFYVKGEGFILSNVYGFVDADAALVVLNQIDELPEVAALTISDATDVSIAKAAYDKLGNLSKALVVNSDKLLASIDKITELSGGIPEVFKNKTCVLDAETYTYGCTAGVFKQTKEDNAEYAAVTVFNISAPGEEQYGVGNEAIFNFTVSDLSNFTKVVFYVYNPTDNDISLRLEDMNWVFITNNITLGAKSWTRIEISVAGLQGAGGCAFSATGRMRFIGQNNTQVIADGWMVTSFYAYTDAE